MRIDVVSLFPDFIAQCAAFGVTGRALERNLLSLHAWNPREYAEGNYRRVDDRPFGGGPGMVMKPTVWGPALDDVLAGPDGGTDPDVLLVVPTPAGRRFDQATAQRWSKEKRIVFACGRYEGIDQRVFDDAARRVRVEEVSIGDYVLIGGEVAVLVMVEAVVRLLPGVLGNQQSHQEDSFSDGLLEGPSYTRPAVWRDLEVPPVLLSGDHGKVARWRHEQSLERTRDRRPDLLPSDD